MYVTKTDGRKEPFRRNKIIRTCLRAGVDAKTANDIADKIERSIADGFPTRKIYDMILTELDRRPGRPSFVYRLREAVAEIDLLGFELFVKKVLEAHGYQCEWEKIIHGKSVEHQVDIIARKNRLFLVECKRHDNPHRLCGLGIVLQVQARFEDIHDGFLSGLHDYDFNRAWLINNTKFSEHAKRYANAKNIRLSGWSYRGNDSLEKLIESKKMYPVTILKIKKSVKTMLLNNNVVTVYDVLEGKTAGEIVSRQVFKKIQEQAEKLTQ
jgi:transcriptional regulator NrdR family protein